MIRRELRTAIDNLDNPTLEVLSCVVSRMLSASAEKWTGKITFELNLLDGNYGDTHVNKSEIVRRAAKKRGVRKK